MPFPVVPPSASLQGQFNAATASGDPAAVRALMPAAVGTSMVKDVADSVTVMERESAPTRRVLEAADAKGGLTTPQGRLAAADTLAVESQLQDWQKLHQPVSVMNGIINRLMGVPDPWKAATYGRKETKLIYDQNGEGAYATYFQNNPNVPAYVVDPRENKIISPQDFEARGFQKYTSPAESPFAQARGDVFKKNLQGLNDSKERANINSAVGAEMGVLAKNLQAAKEELATKYQLSSKTLDELSGLTNKLSIDDTRLSQSLQNMLQGTTSESRARGAKELSEIGAFGNVKIVGADVKGQFVGDDNKTYSASDLQQRAENFAKSRSRTDQINQAREQLVNSTYYKSLPSNEAKTLADNMFNNVVRMKELSDRLQQEGKALPFITVDVPFQKGQPYKVGIANAIVQEANAEHMIAFGKFMDAEYAKNEKNPPSRGTLEAAYTRTKIFQDINARASERIQDVEKRVYGKPVDVTVGNRPAPLVEAGPPATAPQAEAPAPRASTPRERSIRREATAPASAPPMNHAARFLESLKSGAAK